MQCPNDQATLVMSERSGIEIDYCPQCRGVWLDRGELDKIVERASAPTAPASAPAQAPTYAASPAMPYPGAAQPRPAYGRSPESYGSAPSYPRHGQQAYGQPGYGQQAYGQPQYGKRRKGNWLSELFD